MRGWLKLERMANEYGFDVVVTFRPDPDPFWERWTIDAVVDIGRCHHAPYGRREARKRFHQIIIERAVHAAAEES